MKYSIRKITAWLLSLMMLFASMPIDAMASVIAVGPSATGTIIDISDYVQVKNDLVKPISGGSSTGTITVSSLDPMIGDLVPVISGGATPSLRKAVAVGSTREIARFNISVVDNETGEKWQPEPGQIVDVTVSLKDYLPINEGEALSLIHYADGESSGGSVPATFITQENKETGNKEITKFTFSTDGFSVYVVTGVSTIVPRITVNFQNGDTVLATDYVKDADTTEEIKKIIYDPGAGVIPEGQVFKGWTTDPEYTTETELLTVDEIRTAIETEAEGLAVDKTVTYYAAIFTQYNVTYIDVSGTITVGSETVEIPSR